MFGCTYLGDGNPTGNISSITGQDGSIAAGKNYDYLYQQGPDNYVDYIGPNGGTIFFKSQEGLGRAINYSGPSNNYRAIHSPFIFGALRNGTSTKNELMVIYVNYLLGGTSIVLSDNMPIQNLAISPNPVIKDVNIKFSLDRMSQVKITAYNIAGQRVYQLIDRKLFQGIYQFIWNCNDASGRRLSSGSYILRIENEQAVINSAFVIIK